MASTRRTARPAELGAAITELAIALPLLLVLLSAVVVAGRVVEAEGRVEAAARDAARAASTRRSASAALGAARAAVAATAGTGITCGDPRVTLDTAGFEPDGLVGATVTCAVPLADVIWLQVPGTVTRTATAFAPIEEFRQVTP